MSTILSGEEKQLLEQRYKDLEFVGGIEDDLKCGRCQRLAIHHYFSQCGHTFCANCRRLLTDGPCKCPLCKTLILHMTEQKVEFEQRINMVKVTCPNKKYGCPVVTTLLLLPGHLCQCKDTQEASLPAELMLDKVTKSMLNKFEEMSKQINHVVNKVGQLEHNVSQLVIIETSLEDVKRQIGLTKTKTTEQPIDEVVGQIRQMESEMGNLRDKVEGQEQRLGVANQFILNTSLDLRANEEQTKKQVESLKGTIELLKEKVKMDQLEQKVICLDVSLEDIKEQIKTKTNEQPIDKVVSQIGEMKNEVGNLRNKVEGQEQRIGKVNQSIVNTSMELSKRLKAFEEQMKTQMESLKGTIEPLNEKIWKLEQEMNESKLNSSVDKLKMQMEQMENINKNEELKASIDGGDDTLYNFFYCHKEDLTVSKSIVYRWTLKDIHQLTKKKSFEYESDTFPLLGHAFVAKAKLALKEDDGVYVSICFINSSGNELWPLWSNDIIPRLTCVLKDVKNKQKMKHQIRTSNYLFASGLQYNTYYYDHPLTHKTWLTHTNYNADDSVEVLFLVEPPSDASRMMSTNGSITQCISNYQYRLQLARVGHYPYHCSPYFSTKLNGYRVWVKMYLDGFGDFKGKGLTAEISFLCGEYDLELARSFKHRTTVTLINQRDSSSHLIKSAEEDIGVKKVYYINMATHQEIQAGDYLLNDSLIYQINIQPN